jgi:hypothetical protein
MVVDRYADRSAAGVCLADEPCLQVLLGTGEPVVGRMETQSRFQLPDADDNCAQRWQGRYPITWRQG